MRILFAIVLCAGSLFAQQGPLPSRGPVVPPSAGDMVGVTLPLWDGSAPGAMGDAEADKPNITMYKVATGPRGGTSHAAVIIAPGGSYSHLAMTFEGRDVATWMNSIGVTAFVLKYRLSPYHYPIELEDAQRAIRLVRSRAAEFGVDPNRVGMLGFSAGGHLTATAGTHFDAGNPSAADPVDRASSRPDFLILGYPVISFQASVLGTTDVLSANGNSGKFLLGENPDPKLLDRLSDETQVTAQTPPTFIYHNAADRVVPIASTVAFYLALCKAGVPAELHSFEKGGHGGGMVLGDPARGIWPTLLLNWMRGRGLLDAPPSAPGR
jgi:acetyl esterase/lipase